MPKKKTKVISRRGNNDPYNHYIGRGSKWGNPFKIGDKDRVTKQRMTRNEVIVKYFMYLMARPDLLSQLGDIQGTTLACWCKPDACHGDILAALADAQDLLFSQGYDAGNMRPLEIWFKSDNWHASVKKHSHKGIEYGTITCVNIDLYQALRDVIKWTHEQHKEA